MSFLQNMLGLIENENNFGGYVWWWIGLNDIEEEGNFVWLVNGPANYTWWDVDYGEPYEGTLIMNVIFITSTMSRCVYLDPDHVKNCVQMQSAEFYSLMWWTFYCDDIQNVYAVCQLPLPPTPLVI